MKAANMNLIKSVTIICLTSQFFGCATVGVANHVKYHVGSVEIRVAVDSSGKRTLQWQSQPGHSGNLTTQQSCKYFIPFEPTFGSWITTKEVVELNSQFKNLKPTHPQHMATLISEFNKVQADVCQLLVYGEIDCWGNSLCYKPFTIHVVNNVGYPTESFSIPERNGMPVRKLPTLALATVVDIAVIVATAGMVIIAAPYFLPVAVSNYLLEDKDGSGKPQEPPVAAEEN